MASAAAAWATAGAGTAAAAAAGGWLGGLAAGAGGEDGQFFGQFFGTTFGAGRAFPALRANQQFAVRAALLTMKLVNRHGGNIGRREGLRNGAVSLRRGAFHLFGWRFSVLNLNPNLNLHREEKKRLRLGLRLGGEPKKVECTPTKPRRRRRGPSRAWKNSPCCWRRCNGPG